MQKKRKSILDITCITGGILCILYFILICLFVGLTTIFYLVWLILGIVGLGFGFLSDKKNRWEKCPKPLRWMIQICFSLGIILFILVESLILKGCFAKPTDDLEYLVVLGAQVHSYGPSRILRARLQAAGEYLKEHPNTKVIVSGGQGFNEPVSEASAMRQYLIEYCGIEENRILVEDQSTSTVENLKYSKAFIPTLNSKIGIVSSNFHIYRAMNIAKGQGYQNICGIPAYSEWWLLPTNLLREALAVVKDCAAGNFD